MTRGCGMAAAASEEQARLVVGAETVGVGCSSITERSFDRFDPIVMRSADIRCQLSATSAMSPIVTVGVNSRDVALPTTTTSGVGEGSRKKASRRRHLPRAVSPQSSTKLEMSRV